MTVDLREKIYETAEAACRSAAAAWTSVYELAVQGNDKNIWVVEEAVWTSYVHSCGVRNAAIEYRQDSLASTRQRGRDAALARMMGPTASAAAGPGAQAPVPVAAAAALAETTSHLAEIPQAPPAAPAAPPAQAPPLSNAQSAWERAEAAALAADQGPNGAASR